MNTIAFYISNHGFGHASRNIPIIEKLLELDEELQIVVKTHTKQLDFMRQSLRQFSSRIAYCDENVDLGLILKENSPLVDKVRLRTELDKFISTWDDRVEKEKLFLSERKVDFTISDIVPWIFQASSKVNIKSLLISNFTWVEIYKELFDDGVEKAFEECYRKADYVLEYPLVGGMDFDIHKVSKVGMCCREFDEEAVESIKGKFKKPLIFISLGKSVDMSEEINVEDLPYDFIYTDGIRLKGNNAHRLPDVTNNTHDYIKASDLIITKAGWTTISEAICARKPMIVLNRPIKEDENTVRELLKLKIAEAVDFSQLNSNDLKVYIEEAKKLEENYKFLDNRYRDNSKEIAIKILELL